MRAAVGRYVESYVIFLFMCFSFQVRLLQPLLSTYMYQMLITIDLIGFFFLTSIDVSFDADASGELLCAERHIPSELCLKSILEHLEDNFSSFGFAMK